MKTMDVLFCVLHNFITVHILFAAKTNVTMYSDHLSVIAMDCLSIVDGHDEQFLRAWVGLPVSTTVNTSVRYSRACSFHNCTADCMFVPQVRRLVSSFHK